MEKQKRLGLRDALALAAVIKMQEQAERLEYDGTPEEWAPFLDEDDSEASAFVLLMFGGAEGGEGSDEGVALMEQPGWGEGAAAELDRDHFASVHEFCESGFKKVPNKNVYLDDCTDGAEFSVRKHLRSHGNDRLEMMQWLGAPTAREAMERATKGWAEGAQRALSMMDGVDVEPPESIKRRTMRADQGDELDVHSVYRGDLNRAWSRRTRSPMRARLTIRLVARIDASFTASAESLFWRGAAVLKLTDMLEAAGYRVEIIGGQYFSRVDSSTDHAMLTSFTLKDAGAPLDVEQVAGVLCNAGFFRTFGFRSAYACSSHVFLMSKSTLLSKTGVGGNEEFMEKGEFSADGTQTVAVPLYETGAKEKAVEWLVKTLDAITNITVH